jgi:hypothetical protein
MVALDELLYNALQADTELMETVGGRIVSTCFEVSPEEIDNTPLPCLIVTEDSLTNQPESKDSEWEGCEDRIQASIEIDGVSPKQVKQLRRMARHAVAVYIRQLIQKGEEVPYLDTLQGNGIAWDWLKPCYHTTLTYNCTIDNSYE